MILVNAVPNRLGKITTTDVSTSLARVWAMYVPQTMLVLMVGVAASVSAFGQQIGDPEKGLRYASQACSMCHAVRREELVSPLPQAPRFQDVANARGMTAIALTVWFQASHPTMPNIIIEGSDLRNVVQYILSLKED